MNLVTFLNIQTYFKQEKITVNIAHLTARHLGTTPGPGRRAVQCCRGGDSGEVGEGLAAVESVFGSQI